MYKISKKFGEYPFAHRQHEHEGHCRFVHGHNWSFIVTLQSETLDENGFVYDFGGFKDLRKWFDYMFDHTILINNSDPLKKWFQENRELNGDLVFDIRVVPNGSAESLAEFIGIYLIAYLKDHPAELYSIEVYENEKNSATWYYENNS